ncbi:MAG: hypothetical protein U0031_14550 [Thermomicrobiales bacterium]
MALVAVVAFLLADAAAPFTGFNPDESRWLSRAHYLAALADPFGPVWADQYMTRGQPPLGSYVMGAGLLLQGHDLRTNPPWDFSITWEANFAVGNGPSDSDLAAGRRTSAFLTALTAAAVVYVAQAFVPFGWALLTGLLYAVHPFTLYIGSLAMSDALFAFLIALAAGIGASFAELPTVPRAIAGGATLGLGAATKLSPLVLAALLGSGSLALALRPFVSRGSWPSTARPLARGGIIAAAAACITFVAVYPYLWPDPVGRTRNLFAFRTAEMAQQASDWPAMAVPTRIEALRRVAVNFGERFTLSDTLTALVGQDAPTAAHVVELLIPLAGLAVMIAIAVRAGPLSAPFLVLMLLGGQVAITILGMRSEFDRYHVPMAILGVVAAGTGLRAMSLAARCLWLRRAMRSRTAADPGRHGP